MIRHALWVTAALCVSPAMARPVPSQATLGVRDTTDAVQGGGASASSTSAPAVQGGSSVVVAGALPLPKDMSKTVPVSNNYVGGGSSPSLLVPSGLAFISKTTQPNDGFSLEVYRLANYTGGSNGSVNAGGLFFTQANPGAKSYEWALEGVLINNSTAADGSQNVAVNGSAVKVGTGITFAGNFNLADTTSNPTNTSVTVEDDLRAVGGDAGNARAIEDLFGLSYDGNDDTINRAIRINSDSKTLFGDVIQFNLGPRGCTNLLNDIGGVSGFKVDCSGNITSGRQALSTWGGRNAISGYSAGSATILGAGGGVRTSASHFNTSADGQITITTGTGVSGSGVVASVNFADTRARPANCVVSGGGPTNPGFYASGTSATTLTISDVSDMNSSATYIVSYVCGGN